MRWGLWVGWCTPGPGMRKATRQSGRGSRALQARSAACIACSPDAPAWDFARVSSWTQGGLLLAEAAPVEEAATEEDSPWDTGEDAGAADEETAASEDAVPLEDEAANDEDAVAAEDAVTADDAEDAVANEDDVSNDDDVGPEEAGETEEGGVSPDDAAPLLAPVLPAPEPLALLEDPAPVGHSTSRPMLS
jgi:hypothetical protein